MFPICHGDLGASVHPICLGSFGGISTSIRHPFISPSVHNSHTSCSPSLWVASVLNWMPVDICYASCSSSFLCSFHYVSSFYYHGCDYYSSSDCCVFHYIISSLSGYNGSLLDGASHNIRSAWCGSTTTADIKALWRCCWPCHCATAATSISDASSGLCQLHHGSSAGRFPFQSWASLHFLFLYVWCLFWCMLSAFRCHAGCHIHLWGLNNWGLHYCKPLELPHGRHMCQLVMVIGTHQVCTEWLSPPLLWVGGASSYSFSCPQPSHLYGVVYSFGGLAESHSIPPLHCMVGRGLLFEVWFHLMTQLTLNLCWALNLVILVWWLGMRLLSLLTPILQSSVLHSHIYPGFTGKVSSLTHFPLEPGCEDYSFLDQAVADFEQGWDSILIDSIKTP